ncbi:MAG: TetR/AcrR family transcriptional regulator [Bacteroidota bacterium]|nr:TetR/AcrR family transcriptional regulator [Bacteroidota bacterium]
MKLTKKQQIEQKAKELFWKHGFKKVTIDEICKKANVSRKTFYTFYENKTALVIYIFNEVMEEAFTLYEDIINCDAPFSEKIEKIFAYKYEIGETISMEFVADFYNPEAGELLALFNAIIEKSMVLMRNFFQKAQVAGEMNPRLNLDYVMWLMQKTVDLCGTQELMSLFPDADSMTRQVSQSLIYGIMPVKTIHNA